MVPQEFYIRNETENEARGPFNLEQVMSLVDAGQVSAETLYYDATTEQWVAIGATAEVKAAVFPEKKKLVINKALKIKTLNVEKEGDAPIEVNDMLAAAEGKSHDTKDKSAVATAADRCAKIGTWTAIATFFIAAIGELLPAADLFTAFDPVKLISYPLVVFGAADIALGLLLCLGVIAIYPLVRFRAALGLGFAGFLFWSNGEATPMLAVTAGSVGLYCCTIFVSYVPTTISALLAIGGMGGFAWLMMTS